jgi:hypothetical protein
MGFESERILLLSIFRSMLTLMEGISDILSEALSTSASAEHWAD